jgi:2-polyprenyl-3-methyl-5-hydroxy-6-metoxy-1,4-benzoquinol methylase
LLNEIEKSPNHQDDFHLIYKSIEEKLTKIENKLKKNSLNTEQNQHQLHLIDRFKEKFLQKKMNKSKV